MPRPSAQPVAVPGVVTTVEDDAPAADNTEVEALRIALAAREAELAVLRAGRAPESVVYTPVTPHGARKLAESEFRTLTCAQVQQMLQAGEISLNGRPSVLCADGYFCDPLYR